MSRHPVSNVPYILLMRPSVVISALAAMGLAASMVVLGVVPAPADRVGPASASPTAQPRTEPAQVTILGDSHIVLMINDLYPGAHANGNEGTRLDNGFVVYGLNGIKLSQVVNGRGVVKAGERAVGTTNVVKWRKALRTGPDTIVVNLGTNDGGPKATDIDKFMRLVGKDRQVYWIEPYYTSCPACRAIHDVELTAAAKRHANLDLIKVKDLRLDVSSDGLHAFGRGQSQALWDRINETITAAAR